jgi:hypothetical protein
MLLDSTNLWDSSVLEKQCLSGFIPEMRIDRKQPITHNKKEIMSA